MGRALVVLFGLLAGVAGAAEPSARVGEALFTGARPLQNGGAPCGACHSPGGSALALQATLGPELSTGLATMDPAALDGLLETLPFPTMVPVYEGKPLTPEERGALVAYLIPAAAQGVPRDGWRFGASAAGLAVLFFLALGLAWRRRKAPSRARLLSRAHVVHGGSR